jgi:hypothetical protein
MTATRGADRQARHAVEARLRAVTADITDLERTRRWINVAVWGIALGVMIYGAINVTALLIDHGVWVQVAWLLSVMIDLTMCVALMGDRVLHRYGRRDGWVTALRWLTAVMTLVLNTTRPALAHDWVGVGIHTAGPVLLMLVAEGASSFQRQLATIIRDLQTQLRELTEATEYRDETGLVAGAATPRSRRLSHPGPDPTRPAPAAAERSRKRACERPQHQPARPASFQLTPRRLNLHPSGFGTLKVCRVRQQETSAGGDLVVDPTDGGPDHRPALPHRFCHSRPKSSVRLFCVTMLACRCNAFTMAAFSSTSSSGNVTSSVRDQAAGGRARHC